MTEALYNSLLAKWEDFLNSHWPVGTDPIMDECLVLDRYDILVEEFCKQHNYSDKTKEFVFYGHWWDTFRDKYYLHLEKEGIKTKHESPMEDDWDYNKQFRLVKGCWVEASLK